MNDTYTTYEPTEQDYSELTAHYTELGKESIMATSKIDLLENEHLLYYLDGYPGNRHFPGWPEDNPEKECAWASSLIQAACHKAASDTNAFSSYIQGQIAQLRYPD